MGTPKIPIPFFYHYIRKLMSGISLLNTTIPAKIQADASGAPLHWSMHLLRPKINSVYTETEEHVVRRPWVGFPICMAKRSTNGKTFHNTSHTNL